MHTVDTNRYLSFTSYGQGLKRCLFFCHSVGSYRGRQNPIWSWHGSIKQWDDNIKERRRRKGQVTERWRETAAQTNSWIMGATRRGRGDRRYTWIWKSAMGISSTELEQRMRMDPRTRAKTTQPPSETRSGWAVLPQDGGDPVGSSVWTRLRRCGSGNPFLLGSPPGRIDIIMRKLGWTILIHWVHSQGNSSFPESQKRGDLETSIACWVSVLRSG